YIKGASMAGYPDRSVNLSQVAQSVGRPGGSIAEPAILNPLQALTYLGFKLVMAPLLVITGLIYMFYRTIDTNNMVVFSEIPLDIIAFLHTLGAYLIIMFAIVHVYMTTTGETPTSNIRAMLTGYEELPAEEDENDATSGK
ncbi:MAG: cytochrome b/b6 domain-containing protein, partial [Bacteroidales bacterium]